MRQLQDIVADRVELAGITRRQLESACDEVATVQWERLPLYTTETLDGEELQPHLAVRTGLDLESFVAVYEEFIAGFIATSEMSRVSPSTWLQKGLGLSAQDAAQLFASGSGRRGRRSCGPRDLLLMTVALAALASYSFDTVTEENSPTDFVVRADAYSFGVMGGRPVTNLGKRGLGPRISVVSHRLGLAHAGRGEPTAFESSRASIFAQLRAFAETNPDLIGERREAWNLALALLRWRSRGHEPRRIGQAITEGVDPAGFRQALHLASGFAQFDRPYQELRMLLVPTYVKPDEFRDLFGSAPRRAGHIHQRMEQWRMALDHLSERIKETA